MNEIEQNEINNLEETSKTTENGSEKETVENNVFDLFGEEDTEKDNLEVNETIQEEIKEPDEDEELAEIEREYNDEPTPEETIKPEEPIAEEVRLDNKELEEIEEVKPIPTSFKETSHRFDPGDAVFVSDFRNIRDSVGYTKIENQFRFAPLEGEIEKVVITKENNEKIVQYKLKNKAGSLYDEEDVCATYEEADMLCKEKNRG